MSGSFGGSKSSGSSKSVTKIDKALVPLRDEILSGAMSIAQNPQQAYQGERVAGFNPMQEQVFGQVGQLAGQGQGLAQKGFNILSGLGTADQGINKYMNPYTQEVIDRSMSDLERQRQMQLQQTGGQALAAKAFGGSRQGVAEALTNEAFARQMGDLSSQLRLQGFNTALGASQAELAQQQALAQQLGQTGYGAMQSGLDAGTMKQQLDQARLEAEREAFYEPMNLRQQNLDFLTGIASGVPQGSTTKGSSSSSSMGGSLGFKFN